MQDLGAHFAQLLAEQDAITKGVADAQLLHIDVAPKERRGGSRKIGPAIPNAIRVRNYKQRRKAKRHEDIAVLDMETDPFNDETKDTIAPFVAALYSDQFDPIIIWEENETVFLAKVVRAIESLPRQFTIYAHNGGRFDFMFFIKRLRGRISFKGRGIMCATIGAHQLRDSFHIIPEKLAAFQKEAFDYQKMRKDRRGNHKAEIIDYLFSDCRYLLDIVKTFIANFGLKISIGQAAMYELKKHYDPKPISENWDAYLRQFFFGGRVECLRGRGRFSGDYKLYDVNSLYPRVMADFEHPIGDAFDSQIRFGKPSDDTVFLDIECMNNGALVGRNENMETTATIRRGRFMTTIWEYQTALKHNLISDVRFNYVVDCKLRTNFKKFVHPLYEKRLITKAELFRMKNCGLAASAAYIDMKKDDIFYKLLLNNAYGKFAQNPRNFREHYITDPDEVPPPEWFNSMKRLSDIEKEAYALPHFECDEYWIWQKPNPGFQYNNVGTAASITGAARAVLLDGLMNARDPIYCDTDSIICKELDGVHIDKVALGAWDLEDEFSEVIINGKKLYSVKHKEARKRTPEELAIGLDPLYSVKSKGASRITWPEMETMLAGGTVTKVNRAPTMTRYGEQFYMTRAIKATAPLIQIGV